MRSKFFVLLFSSKYFLPLVFILEIVRDSVRSVDSVCLIEYSRENGVETGTSGWVGGIGGSFGRSGISSYRFSF